MGEANHKCIKCGHGTRRHGLEKRLGAVLIECRVCGGTCLTFKNMEVIEALATGDVAMPETNSKGEF